MRENSASYGLYDNYGTSRFFATSDGSRTGITVTTDPMTLTATANLWGVLFSGYSVGGGGLYAEYLNANANALTAGSATNIPAVDFTSNVYLLGRAGVAATWTGNYCEILTYSSAFTTAQQQAIEGYMAWKWGTAALLPSGHPFFSVAPTAAALVTSTTVSPTDVTMSAFNIGVDTTVTVTWTAPASVDSYIITFYSVATAVTTGGTFFQQFTGVTTTQTTSRTLVLGQYYYAVVIAVLASVNSIGAVATAAVLTG